ncbi:MAG: hypothetical protein ABI040_00830 [Rhodoferax sp.]
MWSRTHEHDSAPQPTALIVQGNTLADPEFRNGSNASGGVGLKSFNFVVANIPPSATRDGASRLGPLNDPRKRVESYGTPPAEQCLKPTIAMSMQIYWLRSPCA